MEIKIPVPECGFFVKYVLKQIWLSPPGRLASSTTLHAHASKAQCCFKSKMVPLSWKLCRHFLTLTRQKCPIWYKFLSTKEWTHFKHFNSIVHEHFTKVAGDLIIHSHRSSSSSQLLMKALISKWRHGGVLVACWHLMVSRPGLWHDGVPWTKNFTSHCLSPSRCINGCQQHTAGGNPVMG